MEILNIIGSIASIVSLFIAQKVVKVGNQIKVRGKRNLTIGGDANL